MAVSRNNRGFTLAEALVVAVIMSILAASAIPMYAGYIKKQKRDVARGLAQTASVSANLYYRRRGVDPPDSASLNLFISDPARYRVSINGNNVQVTDISAPSDTVIEQAAFR